MLIENKFYRKMTGCLAAVWMLSGLLFPAVQASESPVVTTVVEDAKFEDMLQAVKEVIQGRGINIAHTLPASDMLSRTGDAFGIKQQIFKHAETIEFCSAKISHKLAQANYENILLCPFTISVYVLNSDPDNVRLSYRKPFVMDDDQSRAAVRDMVEFVAGIVEEAADW